jgi:type VI secretion system secreted protein VgrG
VVPLLADGAGSKQTEKKKGEKSDEKKTQAELTWVAIELVDEAGAPMAGVRYRLVLPNGEVRQGKLGKDGTARADDIPGGDCKISFPDLDENLLEADG